MKKFVILSACLFSTTGGKAATPCPPNGSIIINNNSSQSFQIGLSKEAGDTLPIVGIQCLAPGASYKVPNWPPDWAFMKIFWAPCDSANWQPTGVSSEYHTNYSYIWNCTYSNSSVTCTAGQCSPPAVQQKTQEVKRGVVQPKKGMMRGK